MAAVATEIFDGVSPRQDARPAHSEMPRFAQHDVGKEGVRWRWWIAGSLLWSVLPLLGALQSVVYRLYVGQPVEWSTLLPIRFADWYTCGVFVPFCFFLARRFPLDRDAWKRSATVTLAAVAAMVPLKFVLYSWLGNAIHPGEEWQFGRLLARGFVSESLAFIAILGVVHAVEYHRRYRERELQAVVLETELAEARLDALAAQLQPHFHFNTLNSISALIRRDPDGADDILTHLGDLLHRTLRGGGAHEVPLDEELSLLRHYLAIVEIRFRDRLTVIVDAGDDVSAALLPPLILQPLVENAVVHGIARRPGAGRLAIRARAEGSFLEVIVSDDGEGLPRGGVAPREGVGLSNTRRRLAQLYRGAGTLELVPSPSGGLSAIVRVPLHRT